MKAKKSLGQNFLQDASILQTIARASDVTGCDVLEVGPGYGALTDELLGLKPRSLISVELDRDLIPILRTKKIAGSHTNWEILEKDILTYDPSTPRYHIVANIPYYITSPILFRFLTQVQYFPQTMVILMQREVAEKIQALKKHDHSYLSLLMSYRCSRITSVVDVPPHAFSPAPKVFSRVLKFEVRPTFDREEYARLEKLLSAGFSAPRKKLINNLTTQYPNTPWGELLRSLGCTHDARAQELDLTTWLSLLGLYANHSLTR